MSVSEREQSASDECLVFYTHIKSEREGDGEKGCVCVRVCKVRVRVRVHDEAYFVAPCGAERYEAPPP